MRVMNAIARNSIVPQPQSNDFIQKHGLLSASSIKKALDVLKEKGLVYSTVEGCIVYITKTKRV